LKVLLTAALFFVYPSPAEFSQITSQKMLDLTNQSRTENGLGQLQPNDQLNHAAMMHAKDMIDNDYFEHTSPKGEEFSNWIIKTGYSYQIVGENLAIDFRSAESVYSALMASPTHQDNILNEEYQHIGLAVVEGEVDNRKTTVLVQMFGKSQDQPGQKALVPISPTGTYYIPASMVSAVPYEPGSSVQTWLSNIINASEKVFLAILAFIAISLLLNILIKIRIQHKAAIIHCLLAIFLVTAILFLKLHFLESVSASVIIM
ncbi:MAG: CAP domain-containing protein, partial [Patescibacteria group bacterium]